MQAPSNTLDLLTAQLPAGTFVTDPASMDAYRWDRAHDPTAGVPLAVARLRSAAETQTVIRIAAAAGIPAVPRGAGSGLSGGTSAIAGGISAIAGGITLSLDRMRSVSIGPRTRTAVAQPGALNAEVKAAAAEHGLWYQPEPFSNEFCSIGGNVATNAGGLCCVKYGVTNDYVLGLTVVLADGYAVTLGGPRFKDVAGLPLTKLFVGSEGTLGVITEVTLRLVPAQRQIDMVDELCAVAGAAEHFVTADPEEGEAFVAARRMANPAVERRGTLLLEDAGVPLPRLGGTITGEHGVGRLKQPWLAGYLGPTAMELNARIKRALDPANILNPGAVSGL